MKKPYPPTKKATSFVKEGKPKKLTEYGGLEKYTSKSAMMKSEKAESKKKEMSEGKSYKVGSKPMSTPRDSMSSTNSMDPKKKPTSSMSKPPKKDFSLGKTIKKVAEKATEVVTGKPKRKRMIIPSSKGKPFFDI